MHWPQDQGQSEVLESREPQLKLSVRHEAPAVHALCESRRRLSWI